MKRLNLLASLIVFCVAIMAATQTPPVGLFTRISYGDIVTGPQDRYGSGSPDGAVTAPRGSTYRRTDDGTLWVNNNGTTGWTAQGGGGVSTGSGNPQGVLAAAVGSLYRDTVTGNMFRKYGGSTTAYGWYLERGIGMGSSYGPQYYGVTAGVDSDTGTLFANTGQFLRFGVMSSTGLGWQAQGSPGTVTRTNVTGEGWFIQFKSANTTGTVSGLRGGQGIVGWLDNDFDVVFKIRPRTDVTTARYWVGMASTAPTASDANAGNAIMVRYSTNVPDAGWVGYVRNSTGPVTSSTSSLGTMTADTVYRVRIRFIRSGTPTAYFSVNDGTEQSLTSGVPATGGTQAPYFTVEPLGNVGRPVEWQSMDFILGAQ